jgi:peptidoglycan/xylan/chitin deacetylase (PgdA/CDA1 family)
MPRLRSYPLMMLLALTGCSGVSLKYGVGTSKTQPSRHMASLGHEVKNPLVIKAKIDRLMNGIFHSYLLGQIHLMDFDNQLDKSAPDAMKSEAYRSLLAIRTMVDEYEHQVNELYKNLVIVSSFPGYSDQQKQYARIGLNSIADYMNGIKSDKTEISENLKPLLLSNLREKQTSLYDDLKLLRDQESDEDTRELLHKEMVNLRATRLSFFKDLKNYSVNKDALEAAIKLEKSKKSFQGLETEVKSLSKQMKSYMSMVGRDTSSDTITPSAGSAGNITGRTWPERTWSLTYDDGPGKSTTEEVLNNLRKRKIPATFFVLAKQVEALPSVALSLKDAGMDLASHSYTHAQLTKVGSVQLEREIGLSKKVIEEKLNTKVKLFRLPYGAGVSTGNIRAKIAEHEMVHVFWTVDTLDWQDKNPQTIMNRTLKQMNASSKNSGIVLFHDIHPQSVIASTMLMDYFNQQNLTVCTVQKVIDQINKNLPSCK